MTVENLTADPVTSEYLRRCRTDGRLRSVMSTIQLPSPFRAAWGDRLLPRPFFADQDAMSALGSDLTKLFDIVLSLPVRLFDDDLDRYCRALGIDERRTALIRRLRQVGPPRSGRADLYFDGSAFKLLEFNVNTGLGGADMAEIYPALLAVEPFLRFAREFGLHYRDALATKAGLLRDAAAAVSGGRDPVIAAMEADGGLSTYTDGFRSLQDSMARHGVQLILGELGQLRRRNGRVYLGDKRPDVILRYFMVDQIVDDPCGWAAYDMICRAHEQGELVLHTPLDNHLFNDKATLALLSDRRYRSAFSGAEQELIDRMVPWTRLLRAGPTHANNELVDLVSFSIEHQQELILKPGAGYAGRGVVAGWETERHAWAALLRYGTGGPFIIQHRVRPALEPVLDPASGRLEHVVPAWGVFFSENGYGGGYIRTSPADGGAVINSPGNPKPSATGLFTYEGR